VWGRAPSPFRRAQLGIPCDNRIAMKIVTAAEMRDIDRITTERFGVPSLTLMENAGTAVAEFAHSFYAGARTFGIICGKGNNGGDGFVAARKLHGREVLVLLLADPAELHGDAATNYGRLPVKAVIAKSGEDLKSAASRSVFQCDVLIDAVLGTGFRPPVTGLYAEAIAKMNATSVPVIAVDIPSGADADVIGEQTGAIARADAIVTFTAPRPAHIFGNLTSGPTVIAPIGTPEEAIQSSLNLYVITPKDIAPLIGPRPRNSNKGMYGHVLVVGGSLGKAGAAAMAGFSALRVGAGLSTITTPRSVLGVVAGYHPEVMTEPLEETDAGSISTRALAILERVAENKTVLAIGPGISRHPETAEFVRTVVQKSKTPIVLDADGLNAFEGKAGELNGHGRTLVLTPHPGEMARLTGLSTAAVQRDRLNVARSFAREHELILVLKGDRTIVAKADAEAWVNTTGNPGMSTGGTGDILTGMVAGMLAQNREREFEAVLAAVYLHGLAGDIARDSLGEHSLVATDLVKTLPEAFRRVRAEAAEKWVKIGV
jgi:ADP-dependent NAD(P)H-hydrate dehydratase / NAD(P)H-hydrate epimerase